MLGSQARTHWHGWAANACTAICVAPRATITQQWQHPAAQQSQQHRSHPSSEPITLVPTTRTTSPASTSASSRFAVTSPALLILHLQGSGDVGPLRLQVLDTEVLHAIGRTIARRKGARTAIPATSFHGAKPPFLLWHMQENSSCVQQTNNPLPLGPHQRSTPPSRSPTNSPSRDTCCGDETSHVVPCTRSAPNCRRRSARAASSCSALRPQSATVSCG